MERVPMERVLVSPGLRCGQCRATLMEARPVFSCLEFDVMTRICTASHKYGRLAAIQDPSDQAKLCTGLERTRILFTRSAFKAFRPRCCSPHCCFVVFST